MAQASSDEVNLGAELLRMFGPDGLRGALSDEFIDELKRERARHAELAGLRDDDRRFIDEINDGILDPKVRTIIVVDISKAHNEVIRKFVTDHNVLRTLSDRIEYIDGTKVVFLSEHNVGRGARGLQADKIIVHEAIGWKDYTERIWPALAPCLIH